MSELPLLTPDRCVLALIDQQAGLAFGVNSIDRQVLLNNTVALAKTAHAFEVPVIISTSASKVYSGPLMPPIAAALPRLRARNLALCIADSEERSIPLEITADYGYFRLRDERYQPADIVRWARTIRDKTSSCRDVYVYFKHEEEGNGPDFARQFVQAFGA